mgnify:CR=1 FL=1
MERIEKIITDTEIVYKAIDGTEFEYKYECEEYEYFLEHQEDILSKIIFYKEKDGIFTQITIDELDYFDYCYLTDDTYIKYHKYGMIKGLHFGPLNYQPYKRKLSMNNNSKERYISQIKWISLFSDIQKIYRMNK